MADLPGVPAQPDMPLADAARLAGVSWDTARRAVRSGDLRAFQRGRKLFVRHDDFCQWAYGSPVEPAPRERLPVFEDMPRRSRRPPTRGSVTALRAIERGAA